VQKQTELDSEIVFEENMIGGTATNQMMFRFEIAKDKRQCEKNGSNAKPRVFRK
jgi:hypothetical protein